MRIIITIFLLGVSVMAQIIDLPSPPGNGIDLHSVMETRRSRRSFSEGSITLSAISELMWATAGITDFAKGFRVAPSAGATFPIDTYLLVERIEGIPPGIYRYIEDSHNLEVIMEGHFAEKLADAALGQGALHSAACVICLFAVVERTSARYGARAERYVDMEIGHIGQNIYLAVEGLNLSTVAIGAFHDDKVSELFSVDGIPRYLMPIGLRK
ncbi:SagB/ThcOx family dehydrogenase [bacterium]|nr:SagB/ThcOx family dehydrogenase [bacterium]